MLLTKTVEESDYPLIDLEVKSLKAAQKALTERGVRIDIGHEHRFWEYGMGLYAYHEWSINHSKSDNHRILDVGAGLGLLGPTLSWAEKLEITEVEPNNACNYERLVCNAFLAELKCPKINLINEDLNSDKLKGQRFDVVFCISVIEHVQDDSIFLKKLSELVASGGLLFITTDVVPIMPGKYHFDNLRAHNYTTYTICKMLKYLDTEGFRPIGEVNLEYKGNQVFDYSFASITMVKQ